MGSFSLTKALVFWMSYAWFTATPCLTAYFWLRSSDCILVSCMWCIITSTKGFWAAMKTEHFQGRHHFRAPPSYPLLTDVVSLRYRWISLDSSQLMIRRVKNVREQKGWSSPTNARNHSTVAIYSTHIPIGSSRLMIRKYQLFRCKIVQNWW